MNVKERIIEKNTRSKYLKVISGTPKLLNNDINYFCNIHQYKKLESTETNIPYFLITILTYHLTIINSLLNKHIQV